MKRIVICLCAWLGHSLDRTGSYRVHTYGRYRRLDGDDSDWLDN